MKDLGLPYEYNEISEFFDAEDLLNHGFECNNFVIANILQKYHAKSVIDITCGTGLQAIYLANNGYRVVGCDVSDKLLDIAKSKAKLANLDIEFIHQDMRMFQNMGRFDACISMFNAIGHVNNDDFKRVVQNVYNTLNEGGIYVFDIFNLDAINDCVVHDFAYLSHKRLGSKQMLKSQVSCIDRDLGLLKSYDNYTIQESGKAPKTFTNQFSLQIYNAHEIEDILIGHGFKSLSFYALDGGEFIQDKSLSVLVVGQK